MMPADVESYIILAAKHNLATFTFDGLSFSFGPKAPAAPKVTQVDPSSISPVTCACGHPPWQHGAGGCVECGPNKMCLTAQGKR